MKCVSACTLAIQECSWSAAAFGQFDDSCDVQSLVEHVLLNFRTFDGQPA